MFPVEGREVAWKEISSDPEFVSANIISNKRKRPIDFKINDKDDGKVNDNDEEVESESDSSGSSSVEESDEDSDRLDDIEVDDWVLVQYQHPDNLSPGIIEEKKNGFFFVSKILIFDHFSVKSNNRLNLFI